MADGDRLKVLHVAESTMGGVGTYLRELLTVQSAPGSPVQPRAIVPDSHARQLAAMVSQSVTYRRTGRDPRSLRNLAKAIVMESVHFKPDIIHAHSTFAGVIVRLLKALHIINAKVVYCPHGWAFDMEGRPWKVALIRAVERFLFRFTDLAIMISDHEQSAALNLGLNQARLALAPNGLAAEAPRFEPVIWLDDRIRVLFIGRFDRQKGVDILIAAASGLTDHISVRLVGAVVADGEIDAVLPANVSALGWLTAGDIEAQLAACDVVVIPSRWEGFGLVALEAMRAGRAVIASTVGGLTRVIADGDTGILISPGSSDALIAAFSGLERASFAAMGVRGRARFLERFTIDKVHAGLLAAYASIGLGELQTARHATR